MKRVLIACAVLCVFGGLVCSAGTLTYGNYYDYVWKRPADGGGKPTTANNWIIALYQDLSTDGIDGYGVDETLLHTGTGWNPSFPGIFSNQTLNDIPDAIDVFVRVFNSTSIGAASHFVNLDAYQEVDIAGFQGTYTIALDGGGLDSHTWGGSMSDGSDWQAVPEPATVALFGLGLLTVAFRRRRDRK